MLELKDITKSYKTGDFIQDALKGFSLKFREKEFVAVLGESGSGKTTLLNIIGGLDRYDSGDLIINGKSTKQYKSTDWDAYRNNSIGFIFQSYNLIGHISVLQNIEMGMTLSGISAHKRRQKALELLERVGLKDHAKKKPNQLSGGQMQRVAIARALANDPDIILADEPTGALDSETSIQIMDLIKEIAKDKLVIMVTHNSSLANKYATRVVELKDGTLISDSNPVDGVTSIEGYTLKKTAMSFLTALKLSFNNIKTKKGRTLLTAFASSIGIIGIALILSLSNGFDIQIKNFEMDTMSAFPITISQQVMEFDSEKMAEMRRERMGKTADAFPEAKVVYPYDPDEDTIVHNNKLTDEYVEYLEQIDHTLISGIAYARSTGINLVTKIDGKVKIIQGDEINLSSIPKVFDKNNQSVIEKNYDILAGKFPSAIDEILLVVDKRNRISNKVLAALGLEGDAEKIAFDKILGTKMMLIPNDDYYIPAGDNFTVSKDLDKMYNSENALDLKIIGIAREKKDSLPVLRPGIAYLSELTEYVIEMSVDSQIVLKQKEADYNVLTGQPIDISTEEGQKQKNNLLSYFGANGIPHMINIFPVDFDSKEKVLEYLDDYNKDKDEKDHILYTDYAETFSNLSSRIMNAITIVLIAFSAISLVVSVIMIGIITYISVLERTKEIGILRALGARKKDITRVFNAETFIIGLISGLIGILIARILVIPTNIIIENLSEVPDVAKMNPVHAFILIVISVSLTVLGGFIPAKIASRKDPVVALRTE